MSRSTTKSPLAERIGLAHGAGARATSRLVREVFVARFSSGPLADLDDGAIIELGGRVAVSTDGFVVSPLFFPGGDIGKLAVCGTVNDVAMCGAVPRFLAAGFVIEEGLALGDLERIVESMAAEAGEAGVEIVTGDTKVVPRGSGDGLFVTTTGFGAVRAGVDVSGRNARPGDRIVVSGPVGDHGTTIMAVRAGIDLGDALRSDCACVASAVADLLGAVPDTRCLRDPTRGGLAAALTEIAAASMAGIRLSESAIPVRDSTRSAAEILGLDPLAMACEGRFLAVVPAAAAETALEVLSRRADCPCPCVIGEVVAEHPGDVVVRTSIGGTRLLDVPEGEPLPRIC